MIGSERCLGKRQIESEKGSLPCRLKIKVSESTSSSSLEQPTSPHTMENKMSRRRSKSGSGLARTKKSVYTQKLFCKRLYGVIRDHKGTLNATLRRRRVLKIRENRPLPIGVSLRKICYSVRAGDPIERGRRVARNLSCEEGAPSSVFEGGSCVWVLSSRSPNSSQAIVSGGRLSLWVPRARALRSRIPLARLLHYSRRAHRILGSTIKQILSFVKIACLYASPQLCLTCTTPRQSNAGLGNL
jgi:hypothetical protein